MVSVLGDTIDEVNETYTVDLTNPVNVTIADNQGLGTITDDDAAPSIGITDASVLEGNAGTANADFTVSLSSASGKTVTVNWTTADGTATAGPDYTAGSGALTFNPGQTSKIVSVSVIGDALNEGDETFSVNLAAPVNASIADNLGAGTITDDDPQPGISVDDVSTVEGNAGTTNAVFTVSLDHASGRTVTVDWSTASASASAGADFTSGNGSLTFTPGQTSKTVSVSVKGDTLDEFDETFTVDLTNPVRRHDPGRSGRRHDHERRCARRPQRERPVAASRATAARPSRRSRSPSTRRAARPSPSTGRRTMCPLGPAPTTRAAAGP